MKYYLIFINKLDGFKVVAISSFDDYESQQDILKKYSKNLDEHGVDWLGYPQVEFHEIQTLSEVS